MSYFLIHPKTRDNFATFCFYEKFFTEEECDSIVAIHQSLEKNTALVGGNTEFFGVVDLEKRKSNTSWLQWSPEHSWIFEKLTSVVNDANDARYHFQLTGFLEPLQLTEYESPGGHYDWHQDSGSGKFSLRKLSVVVQLTSPELYTGADLEFFTGGAVPVKTKGTVYLFPSFEVHRVTPVLTGTRHSLVTWVSGPPFK